MCAEGISFEGSELESGLVGQQTDSPIFIHNRRNLDHLLKTRRASAQAAWQQPRPGSTYEAEIILVLS